MQWWVWLIIIVVVIAVAFGSFIALQAKRRKGGVIVDPSGPAGRSRGGS